MLTENLFQVDNATVHTANITRQWFEDEGIQLLDCRHTLWIRIQLIMFGIECKLFLIDIIIRLQTVVYYLQLLNKFGTY